MAKTFWKIRNAEGELIAQTAYAEDAAALVALHEGSKVIYDHNFTVWHEGAEAFRAGESRHDTARTMVVRLLAYKTAVRAVMGEDSCGDSRKAEKAGKAAALNVASAPYAP